MTLAVSMCVGAWVGAVALTIGWDWAERHWHGWVPPEPEPERPQFVDWAQDEAADPLEGMWRSLEPRLRIMFSLDTMQEKDR